MIEPIPSSGFSETSSNAVKISCRNVWKVYGADADKFFDNGRGDVDDAKATHQRFVEAGCIGAACNVSFDVHEGEIFIIMGLSGSGKSTMVRCISRLVQSTAGEVLLDGENLLAANDKELIEIRRHKMGMVFQNFGLLPHQTVLENVAFPLRIQGIKRGQREEQAKRVIELVGLQGRERSFPRELSGGQQQRVGIARSLAVEPEVWFLDEPFSALDPLIRRQMQDEFLRLQKMLNKTIVFITHDFLEALRLGDRIAIMKDGWVEQIGTPSEVVMHPATDYVREFTQDVPRVRVLTAADVMGAVNAGINEHNVVPPNMTLEEIMPRLASQGHNSQNRIAVSADGKIIGEITPTHVIDALAAGS